jgi:Nucleotidyl transferase AbiEii toxin, Type IV TA system
MDEAMQGSVYYLRGTIEQLKAELEVSGVDYQIHNEKPALLVVNLGERTPMVIIGRMVGREERIVEYPDEYGSRARESYNRRRRPSPRRRVPEPPTVKSTITAVEEPGAVLRHTLVFKGGTALHHCYLPQHRFSEDLDFTSLDHALAADSVTAVLTTGGFFEIRKLFTSATTIKIERLWYRGVLAQPGAIKVEILPYTRWPRS